MTTEEKFFAAVRVIESLPKDGPFQPSQDLDQKLYAYQQQAINGICQTPRPSLLNSNRHKWHAWKRLGNMSKEMAMKKYIEELSKVVETMSYTEAVSNFMDIMYPFYEIVWVDDTDSNNTNHEKEEFMDFRTISENRVDPIAKTNSELETVTECTVEEDYTQCQCYEQCWTEANGSEMQLSLNEYQEAFKGNNSFAGIRATHISSKHSRYLNKALASSVLGLQKSLDQILEQLNSLEHMSQQLQKESFNKPAKKDWKFSSAALLFVLSWPFIAYWLFNTLQRRKTLRSR